MSYQLDVPLDSVSILGVHGKVWPDAALGLPYPAEQYSPLHTAGFAVALEARAVTYRYRTDVTGSIVRCENPPPTRVVPTVLELASTPGVGTSVRIDAAGAAEAYVRTKFLRFSLTPEDRDALAHWVKTFAQFTDSTAIGGVGTLTLAGQGARSAGPNERRAIVEWIRTFMPSGRTGVGPPGHMLLASWHREGGIAGFCDDVSITPPGAVRVSSCKGTGKTHPLVWLDDADLARLYAWRDSLAPFEEVQEAPSSAKDWMREGVSFHGAGSRAATETEKSAIQTWMQGLFTRTAQEP